MLSTGTETASQRANEREGERGSERERERERGRERVSYRGGVSEEEIEGERDDKISKDRKHTVPCELNW